MRNQISFDIYCSIEFLAPTPAPNLIV